MCIFHPIQVINSSSFDAVVIMSHPTSGPTCNRTLQKKWDSMRFNAHRDKVHSIRPTVDTSQPPAFTQHTTESEKTSDGEGEGGPDYEA